MATAGPETRRSPSTLRVRKHAEARRALFEAAMALFREKGYEETSAEDIAARAGFSRATFFNHFGSKAAVLRFYGEQLQARVEQLVAEAGPGAAPLERARDLLHAMASEAEARREDLELILSQSVRDPHYVARPTPARRRVLAILTRLLGEAQRRREVRRDLTAREQAVHVFGLYQIALVAIVFERRSARAAIGTAWRFAVGGLRGGDPMAR
jgi:AcrR family transcriptional regulator